MIIPKYLTLFILITLKTSKIHYHFHFTDLSKTKHNITSKNKIFKSHKGLGSCGSSSLQRFFAIETFGNANFGKSCEKHDLCYESCFSDNTHESCDNDFNKSLMKECDKNKDRNYFVMELCEYANLTFYNAVMKLGDGAYKKAQEKHCPNGKIERRPKISTSVLKNLFKR